MPEMHLSRDLLVVLVDSLLKINKEFKKLKKNGDTSCIYKHELDKACFQHGLWRL